jgi:6,7-dimethyl-8-ribityllumazine synthase
MASTLKNLSDFSHMDIPSAEGMAIALVVSEWNSEITHSLAEGAYNQLIERGADKSAISVHYVPGTLELPQAANIILNKNAVDGVICIGCVIQGETKHFDFICDATAQGLTNCSLKHNVPVAFGVLTTNNLEQAQARSGGIHGNKGEEASVTIIKMIALNKSLNL